jgi:hypothetical protein
MSREIAEEVARLGISRLCHFTPARKLAHILSGDTGILSSKALAEQERHVFDTTDIERWDGHPGHVCCSIEYPNAWYFRTAQSKEVLFKDWVVLTINPAYLAVQGTLFSPMNAAKRGGALLAGGIHSFKRLYAQTSGGDKCPPRGQAHLPYCPTDDQAEVLVGDRIALADVLAVVVRTADQALIETERLRQAEHDPTRLRFVVAPAFWDPYALSQLIRTGVRPQETEWIAPE